MKQWKKQYTPEEKMHQVKKDDFKDLKFEVKIDTRNLEPKIDTRNLEPKNPDCDCFWCDNSSSPETKVK